MVATGSPPVWPPPASRSSSRTPPTSPSRASRAWVRRTAWLSAGSSRDGAGWSPCRRRPSTTTPGSPARSCDSPSASSPTCWTKRSAGWPARPGVTVEPGASSPDARRSRGHQPKPRRRVVDHVGHVARQRSVDQLRQVTSSTTSRMLTRRASQTSPAGLGRTVVPDRLRTLAPNGRQRPVDGAQDVGEGDVLGWPGQPVATFGAPLALHQAALAQLQQDVLQEPGRDVLGRGHVGHGEGAAAGVGSSARARTAYSARAEISTPSMAPHAGPRKAVHLRIAATDVRRDIRRPGELP